MSVLRWLLDHLGKFGISIILGTALITAVVATVSVPRLIPGAERAVTRVSIAQITGTRASYEVATFVADFQSIATSESVRSAAAAAAEIPLENVVTSASTERLGDSTSLQVTFDAESATAAASGVRALVHKVLVVMVDDSRRRANIELEGTLAHERLLADRLKTPDGADDVGPKEFRDRAREVSLQRTAEERAEAELAIAIIDAEAGAVPGYVSSLDVSTSSLPRTSQVLRPVLAAVATSLVLSAGGVLLATRRKNPSDQLDQVGTAHGPKSDKSSAERDTA